MIDSGSAARVAGALQETIQKQVLRSPKEICDPKWEEGGSRLDVNYSRGNNSFLEGTDLCLSEGAPASDTANSWQLRLWLQVLILTS
mmetsp:Transcript_39690/g.112605  ORF Transcript_39690/g.112605 Transcript_39690/m.112605 type:complete len:87 (+) Transcript_39690:134-394(+)